MMNASSPSCGGFATSSLKPDDARERADIPLAQFSGPAYLRKTVNHHCFSLNNKLSTYVMNDVVVARGRLLNQRPNTYKLGVFNPAAYLMWEPDERLKDGL